MRKIIILSTMLISFFIFPKLIFAQSNYVLPYPSFMPGSFFYKPHVLWEKIMKYWHFGSFNRFTYNLKQSDGYLVEAKTLFEYKQYQLGIDSLEKSNKYFLEAIRELSNAKKENKNIKEKEFILKEASKKHVEILSFLKQISPDRFVWIPEKSGPTDLFLHNILDQASFELKNFQ